jgi:hypothetical protein
VYLPSDSVIVTIDNVRTEIEYKEKELTKWEKVKQEAGGLAIGICAAFAIFVVLKFKK